jgi:tol-pal system protein YbgF
VPNWFTDGPANPDRLRIAVAACLLLAALPLRAQVSAEQFERLERRVDKVTELTLQIDQLRRENRELRGQVEVQQHAIETLKRQLRDIYQDVDQRISRLQGPPATPTAPVTPATPEGVSGEFAAPAAPVAGGDPAREEAEYQAAYDLLRPEQRRYDEAVEAFEAFLARYPEGQFADNAQYWLAEANYVRQDNEAARAGFLRLIQTYPDSPKVSGAKLKLGYLAHAAGDLDAARRYLDEVVAEYPDTQAATMARQRLERIAREAP